MGGFGCSECTNAGFLCSPSEQDRQESVGPWNIDRHLCRSHVTAHGCGDRRESPSSWLLPSRTCPPTCRLCNLRLFHFCRSVQQLERRRISFSWTWTRLAICHAMKPSCLVAFWLQMGC